VPLVYEARDWEHGVFIGATMASETTAAAAGAVGQLRRDPFAMVPFCGYHMGDYFAHWLATGAAGEAAKLPRIFQVNWFRKDESGRFLWPGFGENSRVLAWIAERCEGEAEAVESPIGLLPAPGSLHTENLEISEADVDALLAVDLAGWRAELPSLAAHLASFGDRLPPELLVQLGDLRARLGAGD
jgi:phosphoenolpyruvate carboxykinase (GTP)